VGVGKKRTTSFGDKKKKGWAISGGEDPFGGSKKTLTWVARPFSKKNKKKGGVLPENQLKEGLTGLVPGAGGEVRRGGLIVSVEKAEGNSGGPLQIHKSKGEVGRTKGKKAFGDLEIEKVTPNRNKSPGKNTSNSTRIGHAP